MKRTLLNTLVLAALWLPVSSTGGCATILGTAVSPLTGGIDLSTRTITATVKFSKVPMARFQVGEMVEADWILAVVDEIDWTAPA